MKFQEAKARINEVVKGNFFSMTYSLTVPGKDYPEEAECSCFTIGIPTNDEHGYGTERHPNWEGVIAELVQYKEGKPVPPVPESEEAPE